MTEQVLETQVVEEQEVDYKSFYEQHRETIEKIPGLVAKNEQLLGEAKKAKADREAIASQSKQEQEALALKNGQYETLWKTRDDEYKQLEKKYVEREHQLRNDKINLVSSKIAIDLAGDADKAELLSVFVAQTISQMADENGHVDGDVMDGIKKQFETQAKYSALLKSNMSQGGSAPGNNRSASVETKSLSMDEYNKLSPMHQLEFSKDVRAGKAQLI